MFVIFQFSTLHLFDLSMFRPSWFSHQVVDDKSTFLWRNEHRPTLNQADLEGEFPQVQEIKVKIEKNISLQQM